MLVLAVLHAALKLLLDVSKCAALSCVELGQVALEGLQLVLQVLDSFLGALFCDRLALCEDLGLERPEPL